MTITFVTTALRLGETEYLFFPGTDWQSADNAILDTTDFTSGTYHVRVIVRGYGGPAGGAEAIGDGVFEMY